MKLNLGKAVEKKDEPSAHDAATTHAKVSLTLEFSNGLPTKSVECSVGETWAMIKKNQVADPMGIAYGKLSLFFGEKPLLDPLCVSDVKELQGKIEATIRVQVAE